jgi:hypothetical protein
VIDLRLFDARNVAVPFWAASDHPLRPEGMLSQLVNGGMIVTRRLIGERRVVGIENAGFGSKKLKQAGCLLDC